jgi:TonB family protein
VASLTFLESNRKTDTRKTLRVGFASVAIHVAVIAAAVVMTRARAQGDYAVKLDTTMVLLTPQEKAPLEPRALDMPLKGFQTLVMPTQIPTDIPPVNVQEHFDPKDYTGTGVEGGRANGVTPNPTDIYAEAMVEDRPLLLSAPPQEYPDLLRRLGIQGRVVLQAVVDTTGHVEPSSIKILKSPNPAFNEPTRVWVLKAVFRPARLHGEAVRVLINLPVDYTFSSSTRG